MCEVQTLGPQFRALSVKQCADKYLDSPQFKKDWEESRDSVIIIVIDDSACACHVCTSVV